MVSPTFEQQAAAEYYVSFVGFLITCSLSNGGNRLASFLIFIHYIKIHEIIKLICWTDDWA